MLCHHLQEVLAGVWSILQWRTHHMEVATIPKGELLTFFAIVRRAYGAEAATPRPFEAARIDSEPCDRDWFAHAIKEQAVGFPPAFAVSLMAGRHGWVF
jgi:hypothetical protein